MITQNSVYAYDFDPYVKNPNNLVKNETHTVTPSQGKGYSYVLTKKGPFFRRSLKVKSKVTGELLTAGVDYYFGFRFDHVVLSGSQQPVYTAIVFNEVAKAKEIVIEYQVLGGEFSYDYITIATQLANKLIDPRTAPWESIVGKPVEFPPVKHLTDVNTIIGWGAVVDSVYHLADTIDAGQTGKAIQLLLEHIHDKHNPHKLTLAQLGMDEGGVLRPANNEEAMEGVNNANFMTPFTTNLFFDTKGKEYINLHKDDKTNPHEVTKEQVGLGNVDNFKTASKKDATDGLRNDVFLTPLRGRELSKQFADENTNIANHLKSRANPHEVTKEQVGLGNVENYPIATKEIVAEGVSNEHYVTPYGLNVILNSSNNQTETSITNHVNDVNNPHEVTKEQVGLGNVDNYGAATIEETIEGISNQTLVTPYGLKTVFDNFETYLEADSDFSKHIANKSNPHKVTKAQVGLGNVDNFKTASVEETLEGVASNLFVTPVGLNKVIEEFSSRLENEGDSIAHITNVNNPHEVTKEQVGLGNVENYPIATVAIVAEGVSNEHYVTPFTLSTTLEQVTKVTEEGINTHVNNKSNPHKVTKAQVGLGNVDNFKTATVEEAIAGQGNDLFLTPFTLGQVLDNYVYPVPIIDVTKESIGLGNVENRGIATILEVQNGEEDNYITTQLLTEFGRGIVNNVNEDIDLTVQTIVSEKLDMETLGLSQLQNKKYLTRFDDKDENGIVSNEFLKERFYEYVPKVTFTKLFTSHQTLPKTAINKTFMSWATVTDFNGREVLELANRSLGRTITAFDVNEPVKIIHPVFKTSDTLYTYNLSIKNLQDEDEIRINIFKIDVLNREFFVSIKNNDIYFTLDYGNEQRLSFNPSPNMDVQITIELSENEITASVEQDGVVSKQGITLKPQNFIGMTEEILETIQFDGSVELRFTPITGISKNQAELMNNLSSVEFSDRNVNWEMKYRPQYIDLSEYDSLPVILVEDEVYTKGLLGVNEFVPQVANYVLGTDFIPGSTIINGITKEHFVATSSKTLISLSNGTGDDTSNPTPTYTFGPEFVVEDNVVHLSGTVNSPLTTDAGVNVPSTTDIELDGYTI